MKVVSPVSVSVSVLALFVSSSARKFIQFRSGSDEVPQRVRTVRFQLPQQEMLIAVMIVIL